MTDTCTDCDKEFGSSEALQSHNKSKHPERVKHPLLSYKQKKRISYGLIALVLIGLVGWGILKMKATDEQFEFTAPRSAIHWHPILQILIDGEETRIPQGIGMTGGHIPTHTHETDGTLHMENSKPTKKTVTLGYFFEVWGKTFNEKCIFNHCMDRGVLKMFVNGKENLEYDKYFMQDKDKIIIEYTSK